MAMSKSDPEFCKTWEGFMGGSALVCGNCGVRFSFSDIARRSGGAQLGETYSI